MTCQRLLRYAASGDTDGTYVAAWPPTSFDTIGGALKLMEAKYMIGEKKEEINAGH